MPTIKLSEKCSRCPREELVDVSLDEAVARVKASGPKRKALVIQLDGKEAVSYDHLCEECLGIVAAYIEGARKQTKRSARRFKRVSSEPVTEESRPKKQRALP
jgi:hypothetical protein